MRIEKKRLNWLHFKKKKKKIHQPPIHLIHQSHSSIAVSIIFIISITCLIHHYYYYRLSLIVNPSIIITPTPTPTQPLFTVDPGRRFVTINRPSIIYLFIILIDPMYCYHVLAREPDHRAAHALVAPEVEDARDAQRAAHHGELIVAGAHRERAPCAESYILAESSMASAAPPNRSRKARRAL